MKKLRKYNLQKDLVKLMLCIYVFGLIKPITPIVNDVLAHTFFKTQHVATVHYENGKHHIHLELIKENKTTDHKKSTSNIVNETLLTHLKTEDVLLKKERLPLLVNNTPYILELSHVLISSPKMPPKA